MNKKEKEIDRHIKEFFEAAEEGGFVGIARTKDGNMLVMQKDMSDMATVGSLRITEAYLTARGVKLLKEGEQCDSHQ